LRNFSFHRCTKHDDFCTYTTYRTTTSSSLYCDGVQIRLWFRAYREDRGLVVEPFRMRPFLCRRGVGVGGGAGAQVVDGGGGGSGSSRTETGARLSPPTGTGNESDDGLERKQEVELN
jgi:hypothetical protein